MMIHKITPTKKVEIDKDKHSESFRNFYRRIFHLGFWKFYIKHYGKEITVKDLPLFPEAILDEYSDKLQHLWNIEEQNSRLFNKHPSLWRPLTKLFGSNLVYLSVICFITQLCLILVAYITGSFVRNIQIPNKTTEIRRQIWLDTIMMMALFYTYVQTMNILNLQVFIIGLKMRTIIANLIYRKILRLKKSAFLITSPGQIINLMTSDIDKIEKALIFYIYPLATVIMMGLVNYLLWPSISYSSLIALAVLSLTILIQMFMGKSFAKYFKTAAKFTDERIRLMNEFVNAMKIIKMYCWEIRFAEKINDNRKKEIKEIKNGMYLLSISQSLFFMCTKVVIYTALVSYVLFGNLLNAEIVFLSSAMLAKISFIASTTFINFVRLISGATVSVNRITNYLMLPEMDDEKTSEPESNKNEEKFLKIKNLFATYMHMYIGENEHLETQIDELNDLSDYKPVIKGIDFECKERDFVTIIGPVGSGKSSILYAILDEINILKGSMKVSGQISYSCQEAWTFTSTIMDNILFGAEYDEKKYKEVLRVCALERDMTLFPQGDQTLVGEKGIALSGGQRARINLARALYYDADIYLLDDVLSAVDSKIAKHIFKEAIQGYLANKIVLLVTHQLQFIRNSPKILLIREGEQLAFGDYDTLLNTCKRIRFTKFLGFEDNEENVDQSEQFDLTASVDETMDDLEKQNKNPEKMKTESNEKMKRRQIIKEVTSLELQMKVFTLYMKTALKGWIGPILIFFFVGAQAIYSYSDYFVSLWTTSVEKQNNEFLVGLNTSTSYVDSLTQQESISFYSGLVIILFFMSTIRAVFFFRACMNASVRFHDRLFKNVVSSPISFFETNPIGILLNRVSRDTGIIDEMLPVQLFECFKTTIFDICIIALNALLVPWSIIPFVIFLTIVYAMRKLYLNTAKRIRMIEGATKSPVIQHISSTINGLSTVRALHMQKAFEDNFIIKQNTYNSAYATYLLGSRWFVYMVDSFQIILLGGTLWISILVSDYMNASMIALIVVNVFNFAAEFKWLFKYITEVETQMTSVERLNQYSFLPQEPPIESEPGKKPPKNWPQHGRIEFGNVSMRYYEDEPPVLKKLNFKIESKEKIGIVGRTGAGKSSILGALFRMYDYEGAILIDGIDAKSIGLHDLRKKISIIPQDPTLFNGTIRSNLDPLNEIKDDSVLWDVLKQTQLDKTVQIMAEGLESKITDGGSNFSTGLKQLVCLARAILKNSRILVMDEPTANADTETDNLIQNTVRSVFKDTTIITIAHRLNTIIDSDKILVMDAGQVHEFDSPHNLLQDKESLFYSMVHALDKRSIDHLKKIAFRVQNSGNSSEEGSSRSRNSSSSTSNYDSCSDSSLSNGRN